MRRFTDELAWREFYADVLWHRPESAREALDAADAAPSSTTPDRRPTRTSRAWAEGRTGYPIVDAGMRQLLGEAYVHNRVRMIVASFLVKDLHLDWRRGARHFLQHLVDGDLASNNHGWQWVAGTGTDASPYFRVFNPVTPGQRVRPGRRLRAALGAGAARRPRPRTCTSRGCCPAARRTATPSRSSTTPPSGRSPSRATSRRGPRDRARNPEGPRA